MDTSLSKERKDISGHNQVIVHYCERYGRRSAEVTFDEVSRRDLCHTCSRDLEGRRGLLQRREQSH